MEPDMQLECDAKDLLDKEDAWMKIRDDILQRVCAALNSHHDGDEDTAQSKWSLRIHLKNKEYPKGYEQALAEKIEDKLNNMIQRSRFSQVFTFDEGDNHITLEILRNINGMATLDFKSPEATEKGLVAISADRFSFFMFGSCHDDDPDTQRNSTLSRETIFDEAIENGQSMDIQETPYLQFKNLEPMKTKRNAKKGSSKVVFSPKDGRDYVEWLWNESTRTVGEYVAAFAKNTGKGGFFYCGLQEEKSPKTEEEGKKKQNKKEKKPTGKANKLTTGYTVNALWLPDDWKWQIQTQLSMKIREEMLWVECSSAGYCILKPEDVKEDQVKISFIEVNGQANSGRRLYLLEVKVSPFRGVVFNDKDGPEAYTLQRTQGSDEYKPVRMQKDDWFQKMSDLGWCSKHRVAKDMRCGTCFVCSHCRPFAIDGKACIDHRITGQQQCERCGLSEMKGVQHVLPEEA